MRKTSILLVLVILFSTLFTAAASAEKLDSYFSARFNKSPAFYTGPGTNYYRAGNGKAQYGAGGVARVYGYEGSWLLIGYETSKGNYRIGYFQDKYLSNMTVVSGSGTPRKLKFEYRSSSISSTCQITDDPIIKYEAFATLKRGQSCTYLASMGSWAYIEVNVDGKKARGFVPMNSVSGGTSSSSSSSSSSSFSWSPKTSGITAKLLMRLSTRSGPSTRYDEPGTFFQNNWNSKTVQVLGKSWDTSNQIWWVLVDFSDGGTRYRAWTGLKRVNVNINNVPEIFSIGEGTISATDTWRGPGGNYAKGPRVTSWKDVVAYSRENGYVEVEYYNSYDNKIYRCWVPEYVASITYH